MSVHTTVCRSGACNGLKPLQSRLPADALAAGNTGNARTRTVSALTQLSRFSSRIRFALRRAPRIISRFTRRSRASLWGQRRQPARCVRDPAARGQRSGTTPARCSRPGQRPLQVAPTARERLRALGGHRPTGTKHEVHRLSCAVEDISRGPAAARPLFERARLVSGNHVPNVCQHGLTVGGFARCQAVRRRA
jgi:hypothetical protein